MRIVHRACSFRPLPLFLHHPARQLLRRDVHLFLRAAVQADGPIFMKRKRLRRPVAMLHRALRKAQPAATDAEGNLIRTHLDDRVVRAVQSVCGCIAAQQGCPRGPEFGVEAAIDVSLRVGAAPSEYRDSSLRSE